MIPPLDDNGCLPPGVHPATLDDGLPFLTSLSLDRQTLTDLLGESSRLIVVVYPKA